MKKKEQERYIKLNEQRFTSIMILTNVLEQEKGVSIHIKSAIASSLINMVERAMTDEDEPLINLINNAIDLFCSQVEEEKGIENYREFLEERVREAHKILDELKGELKAKAKRIEEGNDILKGICLN